MKSQVFLIHVTKNYILLKTKNLDLSKAHGWHNIPIRMIKICGDSITDPLKIIFEKFLKEKKFQNYGKEQI